MRILVAVIFSAVSVVSDAVGAPSELGRKLAAEAVDNHLVSEVRAIMPNATFAFAWYFDRPLLRAAADGRGRFVLILGGRSVTVVGVDSAGDVLWQHELVTPYRPMVNAHPDFLDIGINGSAHLVYGMREDVARHVVIDPDGHVAFDDTLDTVLQSGSRASAASS